MIPTACASGIISDGLLHCGEPARIVIPAKVHHKEFDTNTHETHEFRVVTVRRR